MADQTVIQCLPWPTIISNGIGVVGVVVGWLIARWTQSSIARRTQRDNLLATIETFIWEYIDLMVEYWANPPTDLKEKYAIEAKTQGRKHYFLALLAKYPECKEDKAAINEACAALFFESEGQTFQTVESHASPQRATKVSVAGANLLVKVRNAR